MMFFRVLKWELVKRYYSLRYLLACFAALVLLLFALPAPVGQAPPAQEALLFISSMLIMAGSFYLIAIYPINALITGIRNQHAPLERSRAVPFTLSMAAQFLANAAVILLASGLFLAATEIMKEFSNESTQYLALTVNNAWGYIISVAAFFPAAILFSCVAGRSARLLRSLAPIPAGLLAIGFLWFYFFCLPMFAAPWKDICLCLVSAAAFFGACWLHEHKYEGTSLARYPRNIILKLILIIVMIIVMIIGIGAWGINEIASSGSFVLHIGS